MQHIKGQGGIAPAEHSKALCHQRLPQAPGKGKAREPLPQGGEAWRSCEADPGSQRKDREDGPRKETKQEGSGGKASQEAGGVPPRV